MNLYESAAKDKAIATANKWIAEKQCASEVKEIFIIFQYDSKKESSKFFPVSDIYAKAHNFEKDCIMKIPVT